MDTQESKRYMEATRIMAHIKRIGPVGTHVDIPTGKNEYFLLVDTDTTTIAIETDSKDLIADCVAQELIELYG